MVGSNTVFVPRVGYACRKICPMSDGCKTKIYPWDGAGDWQPPGCVKVTSVLSIGVFLINYVRGGLVLSSLS